MKPSYRVVLDLTHPESHRIHVTLHRETEDLPSILQFPVWTPGSYLVRDYSRHITRLAPAQKIAKNRWQLEGNPASVEYEVYAFERSVRTCFLDENYAALTGAPLLPLLHAPFSVELKLPPKWKMLSSALSFRKKGPGRWVALVSNDDQWIDCPIIAAAPGFGGSGSFTTHGIRHHVAWVGMECVRSVREMEEAFKKIADSSIKMFGGAPFREYWFLLHFGHKLYGGLEHRDSQLSQFDGSTLKDPKDWDGFLRLVAHEYFHAWNVKSIRPLALGPFDYMGENYTQDIWFSEGLTDYFDDMIPLQAGLISPEQYQKSRLRDASLLPDGLPGHRRRSLAESSFDAWIRYYRPDEDSLNTDVSYYSKGALLGWCWDAHLQKKSRKKWTLARLMKSIWKEFGVDAHEPLRTAKPGFTRAQLLQFAEKETGITQKTLVESWVTERAPLPWREAAKFFKVTHEEKINDAVFHHTGALLQWKPGALVQKVASGSAAEEAGLAVNDELLALNGLRLTDNEKFQKIFAQALREGRELEFLVCRLDKVLTRKLRWKKHAGIGVEYVR